MLLSVTVGSGVLAAFARAHNVPRNREDGGW
jgi:hypothetical protein